MYVNTFNGVSAQTVNETVLRALAPGNYGAAQNDEFMRNAPPTTQCPTLNIKYSLVEPCVVLQQIPYGDLINVPRLSRGSSSESNHTSRKSKLSYVLLVQASFLWKEHFED